MKKKLKISTLIVALLSLTQFSVADIQINNQEHNSSKAKPLRVEEGATKIGEKPKTRGVSLILNPTNPSESANMNIGKVEFYVK